MVRKLLVWLWFGLLPLSGYAWVDLDASRIIAVAAWLPERPQGQGPVCADRQAWAGAAADSRLAWVQGEAQRYLTADFPVWRDDDYLTYTRTGSRAEGERMMNLRSAWLYPLVLAECMQWQGRYLPRIEQTLAELVRQPTWTWPAHDARLTSFKGSHYEVELMSADLANDLAQTLWLLGDRLQPKTREAVLAALETRVFAPLRETLATDGGKRTHWWLRANHNWNAVCLKGVVGAALTVLPARRDRALFAVAGEHYIRNYVSGFTSDGYSSEGPGYWNYGFSHFAGLREILMQATNGHLDLFADAKVRQMALYGARIEMLPGNVAAFGDASPNTRMDSFSLGYASEVLGLGLPQTLKTADIPRHPGANSAPLVQAAIILFSHPAHAGVAGGAAMPDPLRAYFEQVGLLVARPGPAATSALAVSIKAGGNGNHSHNDIGSYVVALGHEQPTGDPGATRYSAKTFSKERYRIRAINSYGHPVPRIDGALQGEAPRVQWVPPVVTFTPERDDYRLDLRPAYFLPGLLELTRHLTYERSGRGAVQIEDRFAFDQPHTFEVPLIVTGTWSLRADGSLALRQKNETLRARIESSVPYALVEDRIDEEGKAFTRIAVRLTGRQTAGFIRVRYTPQ